MPKKIYVGIENIGNRKIKKLYFGSSQSLAKGVKKAYIGDVNGIARCVFVSCEHKNISWWYNSETDGNYHTHRKVCTDCGDVLIPAENCEPCDGWLSNSDIHWDYCTKCGVTLNEEQHEFVTNSVEPTCTEAGSSCTSCTVCGYTAEYSEIPALGHNYDYMPNCDGTHVAECMRNGCGYIEEKQRCTYDSESTCIYCGYTCEHSWDILGNGDGTHTKECMWCGKILNESCNWIRKELISTEYIDPTLPCMWIEEWSCECSICGDVSNQRFMVENHDEMGNGQCSYCGKQIH